MAFGVLSFGIYHLAFGICLFFLSKLAFVSNFVGKLIFSQNQNFHQTS
jgi:hypothetical protein